MYLGTDQINSKVPASSFTLWKLREVSGDYYSEALNGEGLSRQEKEQLCQSGTAMH